MTVYRVEVTGPAPRTADDIALMLTSDDHYQTSDYVITVLTWPKGVAMDVVE